VKDLLTQTVSVIDELIATIYDLYPDPEFVEEYGLTEKLARAKALAAALNDITSPKE
jgi:hypothetical protein